MSRCRRCRRVLKREPWATKGIGEICQRKEQLSDVNNQSKDDGDVIVPYDGGDVWAERAMAQTELFGSGVTMNQQHTCSGIRTNVPRSIYRHSPTGYNFGYGGSGPADLALNICLLFALQPKDVVPSVYQDFKFKYLGEQGNRLQIAKTEIVNFLQSNNVKVKPQFAN